jgi:hypothetical protein
MVVRKYHEGKKEWDNTGEEENGTGELQGESSEVRIEEVMGTDLGLHAVESGGKGACK